MWRRVVVGVALLAVIVSNVAMASAMRTMKEIGDVGILKLEFLGSRAEAARVLDALGPRGQAAARRSLWWDFLFIGGYAVGGMVVAQGVAGHARRRRRPGWARAAEVAGHAVVVAAVLDVAENLSLLALLDGRSDPGGADLATMATAFAAVKWALVAAAMVVAIRVALVRHPPATP
jgi:hypothetical protein